MFAYWRSSLPPTAVTASLEGQFTPLDAQTGKKSLLVVTGHVITLYTVRPPSPTAAKKHESGSTLTHVYSMTLASPPSGVQRIRLPRDSIDSIVLSFDHDHVSVVRYNPEVKTFDTIALFHLGEQAIPPGPSDVPPILRADPQSRCIAVLSRRRYLFVIPVGQDASNKIISKTSAADTTTTTTSSSGITKTSTEVEEDDGWGDEDEYDEGAKNDTNGAEETANGESTSGAAEESGPSTKESLLAANCSQYFGQPRFTDLSTTTPACQNVRDMQFLPAVVTNPTIAFLCEKEATWAGRAQVVEWSTRQTQTTLLTCSVFWASFDPTAAVVEKESAISGIPSTLPLTTLGETTHLPHNATHLTPFTVPGCDEAVLVQCMNSVVYCERASAFGCFLNNHGKKEALSVRTSTITWKEVHRIRHHATFDSALVPSDSITYQIAPGIALVSCPVTGAVHLLTVTVTGKSVEDITFEAIGVAPILSCCASITPTAFFLGSAVGDSLIATINLRKGPADPPTITPWSQAVLRSYGPFVSSDVGDFISPDVAAPAAAVPEGDAPASDRESYGGPYARLLKIQQSGLQPDPPVPFSPHRVLLQKNDFIGVCGRGSGGQVVIGRQNIRTIERTRQKQLDCISTFVIGEAPQPVVVGGKRQRDSEQPSIQHLLLAAPTSTSVIKVTNRFAPLPASETPYNTTSRTVWAETMMSVENTPITIQVCERTVTFVYGLPSSPTPGEKSPSFTTASVISSSADADTVIQSAVVLSPTMLALLLTTRQLLLLQIPSTIEDAQMDANPINVAWASDVTAMCVDALSSSSTTPLLYLFLGNGHLTTCRLDGTLLSAVASIPQFNQLYARLKGGKPLEGEAEINISARVANTQQATVTEARFCRFTGKDGVLDDSHRLVLILEDGEVAVYDASVSTTVEAGCVGVDLFKQYQGFLDCEFEEGKHMTLEERKKQLNLSSTTLVQEVTDQFRNRSTRITPFDNVGGVSGVYICGRRPMMLTSRMGKLVQHGIGAQGPVRGMTPLNCPILANGIVTVEEGGMALATLDPSFDYAEDWCIQRQKLNSTPHFVGYHSLSRTCFVVTSTPVPFRPKRAKFDVELQVTSTEDGMSTIYTNVPVPQPEHPFIQRSSGIPTPTTEAYKVRLFSVAPHWKEEIGAEFAFEENEQVMCASTVSLRLQKDNGADGQSMVGTMTVVAIGTAFPLGEDITCRGRLVLLRPTTRNGSKALSVFHIENCKGPVTALTSLDNYLVSTVGSVVKMYTYDVTRDRLATALLSHGSNFVHRLLGFKEKFLIVGDLFQSVALAHVSMVNHEVKTVARHALDLELAATDILYDKSNFSIVTADAKGTVVLLTFDPKVDQEGNIAESRLLEQADIHLASAVTTTLRFRSINSKKTELQDACFVLMATASGEIGTLHPISESYHRTLKMLGAKLSSVLTQPAGLHPHHFRRAHDEDMCRAIYSEEHIADSDLISRYMLLSRSERQEIARVIASNPKRVLNILCGLEVQGSSVL